jgi:hypothetical protein
VRRVDQEGEDEVLEVCQRRARFVWVCGEMENQEVVEKLGNKI